MRVLQVSHQDGRGGAAQIAWNLQRAYRARGLDARMAVKKKLGSNQDVIEIPHEKYKPATTRFLLRLGRKLAALNSQVRGMEHLAAFFFLLAEYPQRLEVYRGREDFYAPGTWHLLELFPEPVDILHLHNLHKSWLNDQGEYFDLRALPWLSQRLPVVMTLHDAWLISGHCAHSFECERWKSGCGLCPDLTIYPAIRKDGTAYNWVRKRDIYRQSRLNVVAPSHWLLEKVKQSSLSAGMLRACVIPNGVDLTVFHPGSGERIALGLPLDANILVFSADGIRKNQMKDFQTLRLAIAQVAERLPKTLFVALGEAGPTEQVGRAEVRFVPYQTEPEMVARYYRAADAYIHAARADTFPNSVIEALACGTPVVATHVGGIPEQIREGETGFLTPAGDPQALATKIEQLLNNLEDRRQMGNAAAQDAQRRFDVNRQADAYLAWYREILEENRHALSQNF